MVLRRRSRLFWILSATLAVASGLGWNPTLHAQSVSGLPVDETCGPPAREFLPARVVPAAGSVLAHARAALAADDFAGARQLTETTLTVTQDPEEAAELRWVAAVACERLGDSAARDAHLAALSTSGHPLAPYAALKLAENVVATDPARAVQLVAPLRGAWGGSWTARMTEARALVALGQRDEAMERYRAIVAATPADVAAVSAGMPLVSLLVARGDIASKAEAISILRRIATRSAGTPLATTCLAQVAGILSTLPAEDRARLTPMPVADRLEEAAAQARLLRFEAAAQQYQAIADDPASEGSPRCEARLEAGKALLRARDRRGAVTHLVWVGDHCSTPEHVAWARYEAGRGYTSLDEPAAAIAQFESLERQAPTHRLADDARFRAAMLDLEAGRPDAFRARMLELPTRYPSGDMAERALVELALSARTHDDFAAARMHLEAALRHSTGAADSEGMEGRSAYWLARTLHDLDLRTEAIAAYARVIRDWPLSYHAQLAATRLGTLSPDDLENTLAPMRHTGDEPALRFPAHPLHQSDGFRAAISLFRVGESSRARWALDALRATASGAQDELIWVTAALYHQAGDRTGAMQLIREHSAVVRRIAPVGRGRALWRLAYPAAFAPLIEESAAREQLPPAFVRAIAREESSFNPGAVSWANAYGLVQVILPTAQRHGAPLGLTVNARTLRDPETNLRIGTRFMRFLLDRYPGNMAVVPAAYNAGQGALDRWLRERHADEGYAFDQFVEEIPYDETRRYTRRVLQSYGVYSWLDAGTLPTMPENIPPPG